MGLSAACPARTARAHEPASSATAPDSFQGPEWLEVDAPLHADLRSLVARGHVPLGVLTVRPLLRSELAAALDPRGVRAENGDEAAGRSGDPTAAASSSRAGSWRRVARGLAEELEARGAVPPDPPIRPWIDTGLGPARLRLRPYVWFEGTWAHDVAKWGERPRVGVAGTLWLSSRWALHQTLFAGKVEEGRLFGDALVNHTDFLLFSESAHLTYARDGGFARVGRFAQAWGPGRRSNLLFAPRARPFDQVEYGLSLGRFRFLALTGTLQPAKEKQVALHRLEWTPHPRVLIGVSEGAVFHGSPFQPLYLLGIVPYTVVERIQGQDVYRTSSIEEVRNNVLYQLDLLCRWRDGAIAWGELLLDDVGTETADHPTRLGFSLGSEVALGAGEDEWTWGIEGAKVFAYVYSVHYADSDWAHQGRPLGHELGPDVEMVNAFATWRRGVAWEFGASGELRWKGEGRLGQPWFPPDHPRHGENPDSPPRELTGVVERTLEGGLSVTWFPTDALWVRSRMGWSHIESAAHEAGREREEARLDLSIRWHR